MQWLKSILEKTQIITTTPTAYGIFHLCFLVAGFIIIAILLFLLRHNNEKQQKIVILCSGIFLILIEIYKQLFYTFVLYDGYAWYGFPLQLCSVPMYLCLFVPFLKNGSIKTGLLGFMATYGLVGGLSTMFMPTSVFTAQLTISIHSMLWHLVLIFIALYIYITKQFGTKKFDFLKAFASFLGIVSIVLLVDVVGYNLLNNNAQSITTFNMFFISPYYTTSLPVFDQIQNINYFLFLISYIFAMTLAAFITYEIYCLVKVIKKKVCKIDKLKKFLR